MAKKTQNLPSYKNPPVTEVVIGVQFDQLQNFSILHHGLYFERIKENYPKFEAHPPLSETKEIFGEPSRAVEIVPHFSNMPPLPRSWFLVADGNKLVQLQQDYFIHNWRKVKGDEKYPRFNNICKEFISLWNDFLKFIQEQKLGNVLLNQWEITYVNHIDKGDIWNSLGDLGNVFNCFTNKFSKKYLPVPEKVVLNSTFAFPEKFGRLYVTLQPAMRKRDNVECLQLRLTAKGRLASNNSKSINQALDLGHEWIVLGFTDLTTNQAHKFWGREDI